MLHRADATILNGGSTNLEQNSRTGKGCICQGHQQRLVSEVAMASRGPTIMVLMSGGPIDVLLRRMTLVSLPFMGRIPRTSRRSRDSRCIVWDNQPRGQVAYDMVPTRYVSNLAMTDMAMRSSPRRNYPGRSYRFTKDPLYPFGHGLSYTNFVHTIVGAPNVVSVPLDGHRRNGNATVLGKAIKVNHARCNKLSVGLQVNVKNTGSKDGTHTMQCFGSTCWPLGSS
ncbi:putative beta-D-xylosidase [Hibiscus syriacus]|uniref:putative beta-D-xylosidase n=1 Tax=Hibiscus syriacus TaxID=106335 RepID=UPI001921E389|nr:putative beta-D-xylosidase [Hibiscus syriacus]